MDNSPVSVFGIPLAFIWTALLIELTPGPNMTYLAILSLSEGRRAGLAAAGGVAIGLLVVGVLAAFGLTAVITESPALYNALRIAGVGYLMWLAYDAWTSDPEIGAPDGPSAGNGLEYFRRGIVTNILNPKAAVFFIAVLPAFLDSTRNLLQQTLALSVAYVGIATLIHVCIVSVAATVRHKLGDAAAVAHLKRWLAASLFAVAIWLAWSTRIAANG